MAFDPTQRFMLCLLDKYMIQEPKTAALPALPLEDILALFDAAMNIAQPYLRDEHYRPTADALLDFEELPERLWQRYRAAHHLAREMRRRYELPAPY